MDISSFSFAIIAIIAGLVFYLLPVAYRVFYLVLLSCIFLAGFSVWLMLYMVGYTLFNFYTGKAIAVGQPYRAAFYRLGIGINLLQLALLKYHSFLIDPVFGWFHRDMTLDPLTAIILPLGISFFTLQGIGYLINVYKGWEKPAQQLLPFSLYIFFFPKFLSGPVERSNRFLPQITNDLGFDHRNLTAGFQLILSGFFKKAAIANQLGYFVNDVYGNLDYYSGPTLWMVVLLQPVYLYFDFSGYTDMALGFARLFGIRLTPNFERPFLAENVSVFWRRFHMSLTNWFNDYIFKQVSFKYRRWGNYAPAFAVFLTFTLFGIWHGAGWQFMALGFIQAAAINYEFFTKRQRTWLFSKTNKFTKVWVGRIFTYSFYAFSLVFFFSPNIKTVGTFFKGLGIRSGSMLLSQSKWEFIAALSFAVILLLLELYRNDFESPYKRLAGYFEKNAIARYALLYVMLAAVLYFYTGTANQFVYQQF